MAEQPQQDKSPHWQRVANTIQSLYDMPVLTLAARIHGKPDHKDVELPDKEALKIVNQWRQIRVQVRALEPAVLATRIHRWFDQPQALALFVIERYDHFDPDREIFKLVRNWRRPAIFPNYEQLVMIRKLVEAETSKEANPDNELGRLRVYAAIADTLGLTTHRDAFDLMHYVGTHELNAGTITQLQTHLLAITTREQIADFSMQIRTVLLKNHPEADPDWKWHPIDTILDQVAINKQNILKMPVWACGKVTINLGTTDECYDILALLCKNFDHQSRIEDSIADSEGASKAALELTLLLPSSPASSSSKKFCSVAVELRFRKNGLEAYPNRCLRALDKSRPKSITVFTTGGDEKVLPSNPKVIDFAFAVHISFVAHFDYALVNGHKETNPLALLRHGDRVEVIKGEKFRWPPRNWFVGLTDNAKKSVKVALRPLLINQGLRHFAIKYLNITDFDSFNDLEKNELVNQIDKSGEQYLTTYPHKRRGTELRERASVGRTVHADYWLIQLVFLHKEESGWPGINQSELTTHDFDGLAGLIKEETRGTAKNHGGKNTPLLFSPQYFIIVAKERSGLLFDILQKFYLNGATLIETVARTIHPDTVYLRMTTVTMSQYQIKSIKAALIPIVMVVQCLDDSMTPSKHEAALPPRLTLKSSRLLEHIPTDRPIQEEHYFYGRETDVATIYSEIRASTGQTSIQGAIVLIRGPLKVGKTSLAFQILMAAKHLQQGMGQEIGLALNTPLITASIRAVPGNSLNEIEQKILTEVGKQWPKFRRECRLPDLPIPNSLKRLSAALNGLPKLHIDNRPLILVLVDEVMDLLRNAEEKSFEFEKELKEFFDCFRMTPGMVLLILGPTLPTRWLPTKIQNIFNGFVTIELGGFRQFGDSIGMLNRVKQHSLTRTSFVIDELCCKKIYVETGGNPYWIAHLTNAAIDTALEKKLTTLNDAIIEELITKLVKSKTRLFADRFMGFLHPDFPAEMEAFEDILFELVRNSNPVKITKNCIEARTGNGNKYAAEELLDCMIDAGGLLKNGPFYELSSPILQRWLCQLRQP